jgi:hypothetical protein
MYSEGTTSFGLKLQLLQVPSVLSWKVMDAHDNLYNTQCTFAIWAMKTVTDRLIAQGGLEANALKVERRAKRVRLPSLLTISLIRHTCCLLLHSLSPIREHLSRKLVLPFVLI